MNRRFAETLRLAAVAAFALTFSGLSDEAASAEDAITIEGRILVRGEVGLPAPLPPGRDACCQAAGPMDERLVVGADGGLANVLVSVEPRRGEARPPATAASTGPAVLTNSGCAFRPRLLVVRVGQTLRLQNDDPTLHNVNIDFVRNPALNVVVEPEGRREFLPDRAERRPAPVRCNVHTFMAGWVAVRNDAYASVTGQDGRFQLPPLPAGAWRLRLWHEGRGLAGLQVAGRPTDSRGETTVTLAGSADGVLGDLPIDASALR